MKICLIGLGNLGHHLYQRLSPQKDIELEILVRDTTRHKSVNREHYIMAFDQISYNTDLVLLAVPDDQIKNISRNISEYVSDKSIIVHTSGMTRMDQIEHPRAGVLWPLYSFKKDLNIDWKLCPFFITSNLKEVQESLVSVCKKLGSSSTIVNENERQLYHLAAVWSNNFSNHIIAKAYNFLESNEMNPSHLLPILRQQLLNLTHHHPKEMQTGPAIRRDIATMEKHLEMLSSEENKSLYQILSCSIIASSEH